MRWVFQVFEGIDLLIMRQNGQVVDRQALNLQQEHLTVLNLIGPPVQKCYIKVRNAGNKFGSHQMPQKRISLTRTLGDLRHFLRQGHVAFYLGAGVDILLTEDAGHKESPNWQKMLLLLNFPGRDQSRLEEMFDSSEEEKLWTKYANDWPAEIAALARWKIGDKNFSQRISELVEDKDFKPRIENNTTEALCSLLSASNVIFTTNYANYIKKTLKMYNPSTEYIVLDREDLAGFVFPEAVPQEKIKTVYIIHIHGRSSSKSFPILDAWGYNVAQSDDPSYLNLLETLFRTRHVITVGTSWSDVPLRNVTGYLNRKYPYLGRSHLAVLFQPKPLTESHLFAPHISWSNAMNAIYGASFYFVDKQTQPDALNELTQSLEMPEHANDLQAVADFLDSTGDYESQLQHQWLVSLGRQWDSHLGDKKDKKAAEIGVGIVIKSLKSILESDKISDWVTAARIERHMRHQIWLYPPGLEDDTNPRLTVWKALYQEFVSNYHQIRNLDKRLLFDFVTGVYEVRGAYEFARTHLPELTIFDNTVFSNRLRLAEHIWKPFSVKEKTVEEVKQHLDVLENLAMRLLDAGWEAMAAKVITDKAFIMAQGIKKFETDFREMESPPFSYYDIVSDSKRAEGIARATGCFRRRTKVDVLEALWNKDPVEARNHLLAQLQSGTHRSASARIEPAMKNAIGIGLVTIQFRFDESGFIQYKALDIANNTLEEAGIRPEEALTRNNLNYWGRVVPRAIVGRYKTLQKEMESA